MNDQLINLHNAVDEYIKNIEPYPENAFNGRGIVTSAYDKEFESAWILFKELDRLGVQLPVEVFYKDGELNQKQKDLITGISPNFKLVLLEDNVSGWAVKPFSMLRSSFKEIIWIDTDNPPVRDVEFLFDDEEYKEKGSLFWRDVCGESFSESTWEVFNVYPNDSEKFETGQIVYNKEKCWKQLLLNIFYTINSQIYYQFVHGDTGTFKFSFLYLNKDKPFYRVNYNSDKNLIPFGFMPYGPFHVGEPNMYGKWGGGSVMAQRDREGEVLFNHRTISKFKLGQNNVFQRQVVNEKFYHDHMKELEKLYP